MSLKQLIKRSKELYPHSQRMQRVWVRQSFKLLADGKHAILTGGWLNGRRKAGSH
jgi:hypothetical protein